MGWLGDGSHVGQGCQAWTAVGLPPRRPLSGGRYLQRLQIWRHNYVIITSPCKVMEYIIKDIVMAYLDMKGFYDSCQHGFVKGRSTLTNLLDRDTWLMDKTSGWGLRHRRNLPGLQKSGQSGKMQALSRKIWTDLYIQWSENVADPDKRKVMHIGHDP